MSGSSFVRRPTWFGGVGSIGVATAGVAGLTSSTEVAGAVVGAGVGFLVLYLGLAFRYRSPVGWLVALVGLAGGGGAAGYAAANAGSGLSPAVVVFGALGVLFVSLGTAPLSGEGSRRLSKMGCWMVFVAALLGAETLQSDPQGAVRVLGAMVAAVLAWDLSENSVGLGQQIGRQARTRRAEATHAFGSSLVALASASAGYAGYSYAAGLDIPFDAVVLMLGSVVLLVVFLYR
ncbi:MAG: DUF7519 family protein [Halobacteriota archaeon]